MNSRPKTGEDVNYVIVKTSTTGISFKCPVNVPCCQGGTTYWFLSWNEESLCIIVRGRRRKNIGSWSSLRAGLVMGSAEWRSLNSRIARLSCLLHTSLSPSLCASLIFVSNIPNYSLTILITNLMISSTPNLLIARFWLDSPFFVVCTYKKLG